jgi:3-oxoacyl-[acyl-carrier protein] reductase
MDLDINGRVAIITGGSEGIGKATALRLAHEGARVAICARRESVLEEAAAEIRKQTGGEVLPVVTDVSKFQDIQHLVQTVVDRWQGVDILVNNAGTSSAGPFEEMSDERWLTDLELKLFAAIRCTREVIPYMRKRNWGRVVNLTALGAKAPAARSGPSSVSRAAGVALTKALSKEFASENILVNTVCIGLVKAGQHEYRYTLAQDQRPGLTLNQFYDEMAQASQVPIGRVGEAEEAADLIAFLVSERASYITGVAINIDGGSSPVV